jgi:ribonuclease P protein component
LIRGISQRQTFDRLRREGTRVRGSRLALTFVAQADARPELAFAIPRKVGNAVVRNRCRRRIRPLLEAHDRAGSLRSGAYLVQVHARIDELEAPAVAREVEQLLAALDARVAG